MLRGQHTVTNSGDYLIEVTGATYDQAVELLHLLRGDPAGHPGSTVAVPELLNGLPCMTYTVTSTGTSFPMR